MTFSTKTADLSRSFVDHYPHLDFCDLGDLTFDNRKELAYTAPSVTTDPRRKGRAERIRTISVAARRASVARIKQREPDSSASSEINTTSPFHGGTDDAPPHRGGGILLDIVLSKFPATRDSVVVVTAVDPYTGAIVGTMLKLLRDLQTLPG